MKPILPCLLAFLCCVSLPVSASEDVVASSPLASPQAVAPRIWAPALAPELTLDESSGFLRTAQPPGFAQLLVRIAGNAAAEATLVVSRPGDAASARSIRIQGDGWQRITLVYGRLGWSATNPLSVVISAPDFAGSVAFAPANDPAWPSGSGLSDAQLLNRLDLARPELAEVRTRSLRYRFVIVRDETLIAEGSIAAAHVAITPDGIKAVPLPEQLRQKLLTLITDHRSLGTPSGPLPQ
jgi:hypothetical protein